MKIYTLDKGWAGSVVVIETSKERALEIMKQQHPEANDDDLNCIEESEITEGFSFVNLGDLW